MALRGLTLNLAALCCAVYADAAAIDTVRIGNPGNADDGSSLGAVAASFRIGRTEVTNVQYAEFLNGVDPAGANELALYHSRMSSDARGGINFNAAAADGSKYEIKAGRDNNPVVFVSWYDSIRFANWLHNGGGDGATETGAYTLGPISKFAIPLDSRSVVRNPGARWWLPNENEWYKAAYHKNDGQTGNYWDYPTSTDAIPFSDQPPGSDAPTQSNTANFFKFDPDNIADGYDDGYAAFDPASFDNTENYLTDAGSYILSASPYGTYDQGGNVFEWNETMGIAATRGIRGGSWSGGYNYLGSSLSGSEGATEQNFSLGFRVATVVPESSSLVLSILAAAGVLLWRKPFAWRSER